MSASTAIVLLAVVGIQTANAANRTAVASGNWSSTSTWANSNNNCGAGSGAGVPGAKDSVFICNGVTVTMDVTTAAIGSLTVNAGGVLQGDNTGHSLTSAGNITNSGTISFTGTTAATIALSSAQSWSGTGAWNLNDINLGANALSLASGTVHFAAATPIVRTTGTLTAVSTATLDFNGSSAQSLPSAGITYGTLSINNSAGVTLGATLTGTGGSPNLLGSLTVGNTSTGLLTVPSGMSITLASGANFQLLGSSTLNLQGGAGMVTVSGGGTKTFNTTAPCSTVNYSGTAQTVSNESYGSLALSGSGVKTMPASAMTVACDFTMSGTASATAGAAVTVGGNFNIGNGTTFNTGSFAHPISGDFVINGTLSGTGPITLNGSGTNIDGTGSVTDTGTLTISTGSKTILSTATLSFPQTIAITGAVTVTNNGTITSTAAGGITGTVVGSTWTNAANSTLTIKGPLLATGALDASANPNTVTYNGTSAQTVKSATYYHLTASNAAGTALSGAISVNGNLTISSGTLSDNGNQITGNSTGTLSMASGAGLAIGSAATATAFPTAFTAANISLNTASNVSYVAGVAQTASAVPTYGNLTIANAAAVVTSLGGDTTVNGTLTLNPSGTLAVGANTLTLNGPAIAGTPTKLTTTSASSLTFGGASAGVSVPSSVVNLNNLTLGNSVTLNSAITLAGNVLISPGGALDVTPSNYALSIVGNFTNNNAAASFNARGGTVTMSGSAAQTIGGSASTTFNSLTIANTNSGTPVAVSTNISVSGTLTVNTSAPLAPATGVVINNAAAQGTITGNGTVQVSRTAATADYASQYKFTTNTLTNLTVEYDGTAGQTVSALAYGGLKINNSSGATLASGTTTVGGTLTLTSGTLSVAGNTLALNGPTIAGTPTNLSTTSSSNLSFGGTSSGVNVPSSVTQLNNLTLNNSNGLTLNSSPTIGGTMTFTSGVISAGANTLIIGSGGAVSRTSGHVNGNLQKNVATGSNIVRTFEVGDSTIYSPVQITFASVSAAGNLIAKAISGEHPDIANSTIDSTHDVGRYWVVTNSGVTFTNYSASWTYVVADIDAGSTASIFGIGKADSCNPSLQNCTWTYPTIVGTPTTTNAQASGMTSFSSFAVGRNVRSFSVSNPGTQSQYVPFTVTIIALDALGSPATNFTGTVDITSSGCTISSGGGTSANFVGGQLTPTITFASSGNCNITVTRTGGSETGTSTTFTVNPTSFNAFESATAANAISGNIQTKLAGAAFSLDVVAISGGAKAAGFNNQAVKLELLANSGTAGTGYGSDNCPTSNTVLQTIASFTLNSGRSTASFSAVSNVYRDVRVRISYPTASSTTVVCSGDSFAIRPSGFTISVTDATWSTAGTSRALNNTSASGGNVHKAGQPFTITATASPGTVALYDGNITTASGGLACTSFGSGCTNGALSIGSWSTGATRSTTTANYSEAGVFSLTLEDRDFASIDASDGSSYIITQTTAPVSVGRFVPDHFKFVSPSTPQLQTFGSSCSTRSFTYIGQPFWYVTLPSATLQAVAADDATVTSNYRGSLFKLTGAAITETYSSSTGPVLISTAIGTAQLTSGNGTGTYSANSSGTLTYTRSTTIPASPFSANISLSVAATDTNEEGANQGDINTSTALAFNSIVFDAGALFRYGRLRLQNSSGLLNVDLPIPAETQYWSGTAFTTNTDDKCTALSAANLSLSSYSGGISAANMGASHITVGGAFASGIGSLRLTKPSPAATSPGATTLTVDLAAESKSYLQGAWSSSTYTDNPSARATFGVFGSQPKNFIFQRENY